MGLELDPDFLPSFAAAAPAAKPKTRGWFRSGVSSGIDQFQGILGAAAQGVGKATGIQGIEDYGRGVSQGNIAEAQVNGRADLEIAPWKEGGASVAPWLGYQAAKQLPMIATYLAGGKAYRMAGGPVPKIAEDIGMAIPRALGGGGLRSGASFEARRAAVASGSREAGKALGSDLVGGSVAGMPLAFGSMIQEADSKPGGLTDGDVGMAALLAAPYSALDALQPAALKGLLKRGSVGNIVRRVATAGAVGAAAEVPQEGMQTAMELAFRPDMSVKDKMTQIVDAALTGGAVGGVFGGVGGIRRMKSIDPTTVTTENLDEITKQFLLPAPKDVAGEVPAPGTVVGVDPTGEASVTSDNQSYAANEPGAVSRPFKDISAEELQSGLGAAAKAIKAGTATDEVKQFVEAAHAELVNRNPTATINPVDDEVAGAEQLELNQQRGASGQNFVAPAPATDPPTWEAQRDTLLKGVATRKWYTQATNEEELDIILRARLEGGSTAKSDFELAKRRGIDVDAKGTPVEAAPTTAAQPTTIQAPVDEVATTTTPEPAAPANVKGGDAAVDPAFKTRWKELTKGLQGDAAKALRSKPPKTEAEALRRVYDALGGEGPQVDDPATRGFTAIDNLAQRMGILDDNKVLTPLAVELAKTEPIPRKEAVKAAKAQGLKGRDITNFVAGVLNQTDGASVSAKAAGQAAADGAAWAEERNSVPRGALKKYEPQSYTGDVTDTQVAQEQGKAQPQARVVPPEVTQLQTVNNAVDATKAAFATPDDDVAQLKSMVRAGDVEGALEGLQRVQSGKKLFRQPASKRPDFKGEVATRGAPRLDTSVKWTMSQMAADRAGKSRATKAEAERAIRKYEFNQAIDRAFNEGEIDGPTRIKLVVALRRGNLTEVANAVSRRVGEGPTRPPRSAAQRQAFKDEFTEQWAQAVDDEVQELQVDENGLLTDNQEKLTRRDFLAGVAATAALTVGAPARATALPKTPATAAMSDMVIAGDVKGVLRLLATRSTNSLYRTIAGKLLKSDWDKVHMTGGPEDPSVNGTTRLEEDGSSTVWIGWGESMTEETVLHELIHAYVQQRWAGIGKYTPGNRRLLKDNKNRADAEVKRFQDLWDQISTALEKTNPGLLEKEVWAQQVYNRPDEMLSWVLTNASAQAYLKTVDANGKKLSTEPSLWDMLSNFFADLFGLAKSAKVRSAFSEILDAGYSVLDAGAAVRTGDFNVMLAQALKAQPLNMAKPSAAVVNANSETLTGAVSRAAEKFTRTKSIMAGGLKTMIGWMPMTHIVEKYSDIFPQIRLLANAHSDRRATTAVIAHLYNVPKLLAERMVQTKEGKAAIETTGELMELTAFDIDFRKPWADNDHLKDADNLDVLKRRHEKGHRQYNLLKKSGLNELIDNYIQLNEMTHFNSMSLGIRQLVMSDTELKGSIEEFRTDPMETFRNNSLLHNPTDAKKYWRDVLQAQINAADDYIASIRGTDAGVANTRLNPLEMYLKEVKKGLKAMEDAPYFHLPRFGAHFVAAAARLDDKKKVDLDAVDHIARELEKAGITDARISRDANDGRIYMKVETIEQRDMLRDVMLKLEKGGWVTKGSVLAAPADKGEYLPERTKAEMNRFINALKASFEITDAMTDDQKKAVAEERDRIVKTAHSVWMDMLPDTATSKVLTHREGRPGYSKDMIRGFAHRYNIAVNTIASLSAEPDLNEAFQEMRGRLNEAKDASSGLDVDTITTIYAELTRREAERPQASEQDGYDRLRAWTHAFFLGASPSYVAVNMTQLGVLLWPELAKQHGFVGAAKAIAKVTPIAFKIMSATMKQGYKAGGTLRAADAVITSEALTEAVGDAKTAEFLMNMIGSGMIDIGSAARELATEAEGTDDSTQGKVLRYAASAGMYSETLTRLIAALASRDLHGKKTGSSKESEVDYAKEVVRESMLEYSTWNVARNMGKMGVAGAFTPVMMSFLQYSTQVTFKLYRELYNSFSSGATDKQKAEARKFLVGHLTAVTALAGTLGLPFAAVAALAIEKLVDLFDDDDTPYDATAAWRNFLAETLGLAGGEMAARGLVRAGGFGPDISGRVGEQNLLPFTTLLTDKRKFKEAAADAALRALGAPVGMETSIADGLSKAADGDILGAMAAGMPTAIKGPVKAFQMSENGQYIDTKGNVLPIESPGAAAILQQLLGFNPSPKAEYSEERSDQAARETVLVARAEKLRDKIVDAILRGDPAWRDYAADAQRFDAANPDFGVMRGIEASIKNRRKAQLISVATRTPLGVGLKDPGGQALTGYANVEFRAQQ